MSKPLWSKVLGVILVILLILNMVFLGIRLYSDLVFWIILAVLGLSSWIVIKLASKK